MIICLIPMLMGSPRHAGVRTPSRDMHVKGCTGAKHIQATNADKNGVGFTMSVCPTFPPPPSPPHPNHANKSEEACWDQMRTAGDSGDENEVFVLAHISSLANVIYFSYILTDSLHS